MPRVRRGPRASRTSTQASRRSPTSPERQLTSAEHRGQRRAAHRPHDLMRRSPTPAKPSLHRRPPDQRFFLGWGRSGARTRRRRRAAAGNVDPLARPLPRVSGVLVNMPGSAGLLVQDRGRDGARARAGSSRDGPSTLNPVGVGPTVQRGAWPARPTSQPVGNGFSTRRTRRTTRGRGESNGRSATEWRGSPWRALRAGH